MIKSQVWIIMSMRISIRCEEKKSQQNSSKHIMKFKPLNEEIEIFYCT